ncbi:MAG: deoxyribodipyrimidine photo-lyase, partial [Bacteroidota bacterium]
MKRGLVWFTEDLRVDDNETLLKAIEENDEIIPVFFLDSSADRQQLSIPRCGGAREKFIKESLMNLQQQFKKRGGTMLVVAGTPNVELPRLCVEYRIRKVYTKKQVGSEEKILQSEIKQ